MVTNTYTQNSFPNMRKVLENLGFVKATPVQAHQNHFHVYLKPPTPLEIDGGKKLETPSIDDNGAAAEDLNVSLTTLDQTEALLAYVQSTIHPGEQIMFAMDMPYPPLQGTDIVVSQATSTDVQGQSAQSVKPNYVLFNCYQIENGEESDPSSAMNSLDPAGAIRNRFQTEENPIDESAIRVELIQAPKHGKIRTEVANTGYKFFAYEATPGYLGKDTVVFLATLGDKRYKVVTTLQVVEISDQSEDQTVCPRPWSVKVTGSAVPDSQAHAAFLSASISYTVKYGSLLGSAVGEVTGEGQAAQITLDVDAGGHGWYIDPTPLDNTDDYLPTSNPDVWQAKAGTDAAGKMDLLSVLLHEYGHALGLDHRSESGDFMAATLQPGQRRLPSAEELQLMSQLVAQLKGASSGDQTPSNPALPSLPLGALLLGRLALGRRPEDAVFDGSQALFAAHPTLQGGGLQNLQDWATQGQVSLASGGGAILQEGAASQTRLNQVFTINERDRFLSFTLAGTALDDVHGGPDDAFEVALLEADTGRSLIGALSLSHTDALLNLQANGTETAAANVTRVTNPDGSRTYRVDLAGVPAGTAVNLSFDLIGFGQTGSQVAVRDVRVSGLPQLHDDAATLLEDSTLAFDPFAQVDNAALLALGSQVVEAPAHGSVSVNADGTFSYTPDGA